MAGKREVRKETERVRNVSESESVERCVCFGEECVCDTFTST